ncbi:MAG TPA: EamA family transporter [Pyrinomonadaceae bacterium]|nr:EamA family transporter [Pyrinomonadaceae bacterium]
MKNFYLPLALAVGGNLLYHLSQKSIPKAANPVFIITIAYLVGILACVIYSFAYPNEKSFLDTLRESNWAVYGMGLGAAVIEVGFLLAYRAGWNISTAAVVCSTAVTLMLIPIGVIAFREHLSVRSIVGLLLCMVGLVLVAKK